MMLPRLNRDVAIEVLPEAFAADHEGLTRFQREAQVLAGERRAPMISQGLLRAPQRPDAP